MKIKRKTCEKCGHKDCCKYMTTYEDVNFPPTDGEAIYIINEEIHKLWAKYCILYKEE